MHTTGVPEWHGLIRKVHRTSGQGSLGYFEVSEAVDPANTAAALMVEFPDATVRAYTIARMEAHNGRTRLYVVEDPGYAVIGKRIELRTYPQRTIQGTRVRYRLPGVAHASL